MLYFVTWFKADQVLAEQDFVDLTAAEEHFFRCQVEYRARGATGARVWSGRTTYFQVDWAGSGSVC